MTGKPDGRVEVRPNTLRDQMAPNTFRTASAPRRPDAGQSMARSGGRRRRPMVARPQTPRWVYVALGLLAIVIALYLMQAMP
jgi:hypothetical protein